MSAFRYYFALLFFLFANKTFSQDGFVTGLNGTVINLPCGTNCSNLTVKVPHLKTSSNYSLISIPYTPFPFATTGGNELSTLYADDRYSDVIDMGFTFCYYDSAFTKAVAGSNGLMTFDESVANGFNSYSITQPIPYAGGTPFSTTGTYYPPASLMLAYNDLNPLASASPPDRKIEWRVEGSAPFRRFILSFNKLGTFGANSCTLNSPGRPATFQVVLYESTGIIDYYIEDKFCQSSISAGRTIMGIQNWLRNKAVAVPGRNATSGWTATNEGWRFVPSGSMSRFVRAEIYDLSGALLQTTTPADTATTTTGLLDIRFNNICFATGSQQFVVKSFFTACGSGNQLINATDTITVSKGNVTARTSSTPAACSPSGTATISIPATTGPYTFSVGSNPPVTSATNTHTFTGLIAGSYFLSATDAAGCGASASVSVALNGVLAIQTTPRPTSCSGLSDGQVLVTLQNGTPPYQYNINNGPYQTSNTFTNLAPATYVVGAKDASGCVVANQLVTITAGGPVTASIAAVNVSCNNANNGSVTVTLSANAVPPLQFSLDGVTYQSSNTFMGLAPSNYTVHYKDANNCSGAQNFTITQPPPLTTAIVKQDVLCNGQNNGRITITANGGVTGYQYSINGVNYQSGNSFSVAAGAYTVYVKDGAGCIKTDNIVINQPAALGLTVLTENASCNGGADGKITVTGQGGTSGYVYSIDGTTFQSSNVFQVLRSNYVVTIKDANGCTATTNTVVGLTNNLSLSLSGDTTICQGTSAGLFATTNATQITWSNANTLNNASVPNPIASPIDTTKYVVTVMLGACSIKDSLVVNIMPAPVANAGMNDEICFGQGYVLQGNGGITYEWSPATYFNNNISLTAQNPGITPLQTIQYSLTVTDANGCRSLMPATVTITVTPPIKVIALPGDTVVAKGDVVQLRATSPVTNYIWSPAIGLDNSARQNPIATIDRDIAYEVTAYTAAGCKGSDTIKIKVFNGPEVYVPTGFTPNGDGKNEFLAPFPVGIKEVRYFRVYNRWGQLVFQTTRLSHGWDGKVEGKWQPMDTYVWALEVVTKENKVIRKRGTSILIR